MEDPPEETSAVDTDEEVDRTNANDGDGDAKAEENPDSEDGTKKDETEPEVNPSGNADSTNDEEPTTEDPSTSASDSVDPPTQGNKRKNEEDADALENPQPQKKVKVEYVECEVARSVLSELSPTLFDGKVLAWALQPDDANFRHIHQYIENGQAHASFGIKILSIIRVIASADRLTETPLDFSEDLSTTGLLRMSLWHGTKKENVASILENGLKVPEPQLLGGMFGTGIYLADRASKSSRYCGNTLMPTSGTTGYLFLCDVLLGDMYKSKSAMTYLTSPPPSMVAFFKFKQHHSVQGIGYYAPDKDGDKTIDGSLWPLGNTVVNEEGDGANLLYNEYVVYSSRQVQPKYLVKVEFTEEHIHENIGKVDDDP